MKTYILLTFVLCGSAAYSSVHRNLGVLSQSIEYCFAGVALRDNPNRVAEIKKYLLEVGSAANINLKYLGACPTPTLDENGNEDYGERIRINIEKSGINRPSGDPVIPGKGCKSGWAKSSFAMYPDEARQSTSCQFNAQIWKDGDSSGVPWRNHTLHEIGHALGLAHEHERADADSSYECSDPDFGGNWSINYLTDYDSESVMNYSFPSCGISGNYGHQGLSTRDVLALQILYPEQNNQAIVFGSSVVKEGNAIQLYLGPTHFGAYHTVTRGYRWSQGGQVLGSGVSLRRSFSKGRYLLRVRYRDFLNRTHSSSIIVRVYSPQDYLKKVIAPALSTQLM